MKKDATKKELRIKDLRTRIESTTKPDLSKLPEVQKVLERVEHVGKLIMTNDPQQAYFEWLGLCSVEDLDKAIIELKSSNDETSRTEVCCSNQCLLKQCLSWFAQDLEADDGSLRQGSVATGPAQGHPGRQQRRLRSCRRVLRVIFQTFHKLPETPEVLCKFRGLRKFDPGT